MDNLNSSPDVYFVEIEDIIYDLEKHQQRSAKNNIANKKKIEKIEYELKMIKLLIVCLIFFIFFNLEGAITAALLACVCILIKKKKTLFLIEIFFE